MPRAPRQIESWDRGPGGVKSSSGIADMRICDLSAAAGVCNRDVAKVVRDGRTSEESGGRKVSTKEVSTLPAEGSV